MKRTKVVRALTMREKRIAINAVRYVGMELSLLSKNMLYKYCANLTPANPKTKGGRRG